jgi:hypothetical protein
MNELDFSPRAQQGSPMMSAPATSEGVYGMTDGIMTLTTALDVCEELSQLSNEEPGVNQERASRAHAMLDNLRADPRIKAYTLMKLNEIRFWFGILFGAEAAGWNLDQLRRNIQMDIERLCRNLEEDLKVA